MTYIKCYINSHLSIWAIKDRKIKCVFHSANLPYFFFHWYELMVPKESVYGYQCDLTETEFRELILELL